MKTIFSNWIPWLGGGACAIGGALDVRIASALSASQWIGPGFLVAGLGLAWIAIGVGVRVKSAGGTDE